MTKYTLGEEEPIPVPESWLEGEAKGGAVKVVAVDRENGEITLEVSEND